MSAALEQNLELLRQGLELLERIDDVVYGGDSSSRETSYSVGPHLRHCLDAYGCLLAGLPERRVDYDARRRQSDIEHLRSAGREALIGVAAGLEALRDEDPHLELTVKVDTSAETPGAWSRSTLRRELQFLVGHTVHHFALIALILRRSGVEPGHDFGVAPSTLRHWDLQGRGERQDSGVPRSGDSGPEDGEGDGGETQEESRAREETVVG